ncbi:MAG: alpha/beta hydrolase [Betaproteobacteria bacterium]|nr:alpha/beta hydrolase [Betaproteobacteria bacterium]
MIRISRFCVTLALAIVAAALSPAAAAQTPPSAIGIVVMHGKGGSPAKFVSDLASGLEQKGILVANIEMPWSGRRDYDVSVSVAEKEIQSAFEGLRGKGAKKLFVAGHSQGGLFALYYGSAHPVNGIIAIAPGGSVNSPVYREKLGESVERARKLVAEGKGEEKTRFMDYEGSRGVYPITTTPAAYLSWFDPDGAMNQMKAHKAMSPQMPVLYIVPKNDYPGLLRVKQMMFDALPKNPLTRLYEPDSSHLEAPSASREEIARWAAEVAASVAR